MTSIVRCGAGVVFLDENGVIVGQWLDAQGYTVAVRKKAASNVRSLEFVGLFETPEEALKHIQVMG